MAKVNSTLESLSPQDNFFYTRRLIVMESAVVLPKDVDDVVASPKALSVAPSIVLRGHWLKQMGFGKGQNATLHIEPGMLHITADFPEEWEIEG